jgi:hypothetical protein
LTCLPPAAKNRKEIKRRKRMVNTHTSFYNWDTIRGANVWISI